MKRTEMRLLATWAVNPIKILAIDIETTPNLAHVWGLWQQNVGLNQLIEPTELLCFASKWIGKEDIEFRSIRADGKDVMVRRAHELLCETDVVLHFNGKSFDIPHLNREFLLLGLGPPAPFQQVDLLLAVRKRFKFPSNKLQYVSRVLGFEGKAQHEGHELWIKCMAGDPEAWETMQRYNQQDVILLEQIYDKLLPWIPNHPNVALYAEDELACPGCGSQALRARGMAYTAQSAYRRYQCADCSKWTRETRRNAYTTIREIAS